MESVPTMKKSCLFALLFSFIGTAGNSQTIDMSTLSDYEKQVHRISWCNTVWMRYPFDFDNKDVYNIIKLLGVQDFTSPNRDVNNIMHKAASDTQAKLILNEITVSQETFNECNEDLKAILKDEYIPNFSYMEK
jgi:hypothetical protein